MLIQNKMHKDYNRFKYYAALRTKYQKVICDM
jgi:hypothetical protein